MFVLLILVNTWQVSPSHHAAAKVNEPNTDCSSRKYFHCNGTTSSPKLFTFCDLLCFFFGFATFFLFFVNFRYFISGYISLYTFSAHFFVFFLFHSPTRPDSTQWLRTTQNTHAKQKRVEQSGVSSSWFRVLAAAVLCCVAIYSLSWKLRVYDLAKNWIKNETRGNTVVMCEWVSQYGLFVWLNLNGVNDATHGLQPVQLLR